MTITCENDNDVIVYTLEKVILYAKRTGLILVAQCVWWLASVIGSEQGLVIHIDNIQSRIEKRAQVTRPEVVLGGFQRPMYWYFERP
jgi:hypothetical protein